MKRLRCVTLAAAAAFFLAMAAPNARAQVTFGVQIGSPPPCPYGYFDYPPYDCAPFGYYGPQWFPNGVFIGAGPWYHGDDDDFHGWVNRRYDPRHGYRGELPHRGERPDWDRHRGWERSFRGDDDHHEYRQDRGDRRGEYDNRGGRDNGNYNGQYNNRGGGQENGNRNGEYNNRGGQDNGYRGGQYNNRGGQDNGNRGGQYNNRGGSNDNGNRGGQYGNRGGGHDNGNGNGHDNGHGHGHDDDGH